MENTVFEIAGEKFDVITKGIAQARQVAHLSQWISRYGAPAYKTLTAKADGPVTLSGMDILVGVLGAITQDALMDLFITTFNCSKAFAEENFDFATLIDGVVALYKNQPALQKVVNRFFLNSNSSPQESTNSTPFEQPTDGPTTQSLTE